MKFKNIKLDFDNVNTLEEMHSMLQNAFGFPDFYGKNVNALIDCWSSLRYPEDGMSETVLQANECLMLELKHFSTRDDIITNHLLTAVEAVNERDTYNHTQPSIYLLLL